MAAYYEECKEEWSYMLFIKQFNTKWTHHPNGLFITNQKGRVSLPDFISVRPSMNLYWDITTFKAAQIIYNFLQIF